MDSFFIQISIVISIVFLVSVLMRLLRQPLIVGYIISGIICGPIAFNIFKGENTLSTFSEMGIAFLLFVVGLNLSPKVIKEVGKISLIAGTGQVIFTSLIGYILGMILGYTKIQSLYIALALTFSSTIIIMKLLSDKEAFNKLYGKISIGFLLVQDFIAITILIVISSFSKGASLETIITSVLLKGIILVVALALFSYYILPKLGSFLAKSQEFLFVFAIAWGFSMASLFLYAGFSLEVGALLAGIALSITPYSYEISSKLKPLRDFFIITFFVYLGSLMTFGNITEMFWPIIVFSLFILIGNPIIVLIIMGIGGYSRHTGFMCGLTVAQISEFSLILISLGIKSGHLGNEILSLVTIVGVITITGSVYMIMFSEKIYSKLSKYLKIFERKKINERDVLAEKQYEYFLFGENRVGFSIMKLFIDAKKSFLVVDFNPERVSKLKLSRIPCIYGDISNRELLDEIRFDKCKLVVCTILDHKLSLMLLDILKKKNKSLMIIVTASTTTEVLELYEAGADYVILPQFLGGEYTAKFIDNAKEISQEYKKERDVQLKRLKERLTKNNENNIIMK